MTTAPSDDCFFLFFKSKKINTIFLSKLCHVPIIMKSIDFTKCIIIITLFICLFSHFWFVFPAQICIETQPSRPFFVYGKGWASFNPDETLHELGLKCKLLEIADVCISLTPREQPKSVESIITPQNLSRKQMPHTISTTATGTTVTSRPMQSFEAAYSQQMMSQRHPNEPMYGHHHGRLSNPENSLRKFNTTMAPPPPPPSSLSSSSTESAASTSYDDEAIDATMHSRKRRAWSISDNICDDQKKIKPN